jgi:hypothetical protein
LRTVNFSCVAGDRPGRPSGRGLDPDDDTNIGPNTRTRGAHTLDKAADYRKQQIQAAGRQQDLSHDPRLLRSWC